ncbi:MAG: HdeD family acid-resistance protein [Gammaproteobacteria bacterium]
MSFLFQMNDQDLNNIYHKWQKNWGWIMLWGIALAGLGTLAIVFSFAATVISVVFLGFLLAACGVFVTIDSFQSWWGHWSGFFLHLGIGVLYLIIAYMFILTPLATAISLTFLLGIFFVAIGIFRIFYSLTSGLPQKGWRLFNGLITLLLGILILTEWPVSGIFVLGLFIGIDLVFSGWVYIIAALSLRKSDTGIK